MAIYRVVNGVKTLFADVSKVETINDIGPDNSKNVTIKAENINTNIEEAGVVQNIEQVIEDLKTKIDESNDDCILEVNGQRRTPSNNGEIEITGTDINVGDPDDDITHFSYTTIRDELDVSRRTMSLEDFANATYELDPGIYYIEEENQDILKGDFRFIGPRNGFIEVVPGDNINVVIKLIDYPAESTLHITRLGGGGPGPITATKDGDTYTITGIIPEDYITDTIGLIGTYTKGEDKGTTNYTFEIKLKE